MTSVALPFKPDKHREHLLQYLPCSPVIEYRKGAVIYHEAHAPSSLCLILDGLVNVSRRGFNRRPFVVDVYGRGEFIGDTVFLSSRAPDSATALKKTQVMTWTGAQIAERLSQFPKLAIALLQLVSERTFELRRRIESLCTDNGAQRLTRALIGFAERFGSAEPDGCSIRLPPFAHNFLADYVGTSRQVVTVQMNQLRRLGLLRYSRAQLVINPGFLREALALTPASGELIPGVMDSGLEGRI